MKRKVDGKYITTRARYKEVKKFDHNQFDEFCTAIYTEGYRDGQRSIPGADINEVIAAIRTVKGIGDKRISQIETAVAAVLNGTVADKERKEQ